MKNCKSGYRYSGGICRRIAERFSASMRSNGVRNVTYLAIAFLFILPFVMVATNSDYNSFVSFMPIIISITFFAMSLIVYKIKEFEDDVIGIQWSRMLVSAGVGVAFGVIFMVVSYYVPYFNLTYPAYPASIGTELRWFLVNIVSPVSESLFFIGAMYGFLRNFSSRRGNFTIGKKYLYIFVVSATFAIYHVSSYILGFASLDISQGISAFAANISAFATAFVFNFSIMAILLRYDSDVERADLTFPITAHATINILVTAFSIIKFV